MKVLAIIPNSVNGVLYHRLLVPLTKLNEQGVSVTRVDNLDNTKDEIIKDFNVIVISRLEGIGDFDKQSQRLKTLGIPYILDIDDYWRLPVGHLMHNHYKKSNAEHMITEMIKNAAQVWCATEHLVMHCLKYNDNCHHVPNAIDMSQPQWEKKRVREDKPVFGWIGGIHHFDDLALMRETFIRLTADPIKLFLGGYKKGENIWDVYKGWFSNYGHRPVIVHEAENVYNYGDMYNHIDVLFAPLVDNEFNRCKSELKMLEAGAKGVAFIGSDVMPYKNFSTKRNSLLVKNHNPGMGFYSAIKKLYAEPTLIRTWLLSWLRIVRYTEIYVRSMKRESKHWKYACSIRMH